MAAPIFLQRYKRIDLAKMQMRGFIELGYYILHAYFDSWN